MAIIAMKGPQVEGVIRCLLLSQTDGGACCPKKKSWGTLTGVWVPHDTRDQIVDFVRRWSEKTEIGAGRFIRWLNITASKLYAWRKRYGRVNERRPVAIS
jgi:hypothetical protein